MIYAKYIFRVLYIGPYRGRAELIFINVVVKQRNITCGNILMLNIYMM